MSRANAILSDRFNVLNADQLNKNSSAQFINQLQFDIADIVPRLIGRQVTP